MKHLLAVVLMAVLAACSEQETSNAPATPVKSDPVAERHTLRVQAMAAGYKSEIAFKDPYNALDPRIKRSNVARGSVFDPADDYWGLPRTAGYEEVAAYCAGCHSLAIVMQQRVTPERWQYLLQWMVEKQGMQPMEPAEAELVLGYLNDHFSSQSN